MQQVSVMTMISKDNELMLMMMMVMRMITDGMADKIVAFVVSIVRFAQAGLRRKPDVSKGCFSPRSPQDPPIRPSKTSKRRPKKPPNGKPFQMERPFQIKWKSTEKPNP